MIENDKQMAVTLEYLLKWANALEGMRLQAEETSPNFFSQGASGPLSELRKGLEEIRCYVKSRPHEDEILAFVGDPQPAIGA